MRGSSEFERRMNANDIPRATGRPTEDAINMQIWRNNQARKEAMSYAQDQGQDLPSSAFKNDNAALLTALATAQAGKKPPTASDRIAGRKNAEDAFLSRRPGQNSAKFGNMFGSMSAAAPGRGIDEMLQVYDIMEKLNSSPWLQPWTWNDPSAPTQSGATAFNWMSKLGEFLLGDGNNEANTFKWQGKTFDLDKINASDRSLAERLYRADKAQKARKGRRLSSASDLTGNPALEELRAMTSLRSILPQSPTQGLV